MKNPTRDISTRMGRYPKEYHRRGLRSASLQQAESSMRIIYRNVSFERLKSKRFGFRVVRNK